MHFLISLGLIRFVKSSFFFSFRIFPTSFFFIFMFFFRLYRKWFETPLRLFVIIYFTKKIWNFQLLVTFVALICELIDDCVQVSEGVCPEDCVMSPWSEWGRCRAFTMAQISESEIDCGVGKSVRTRSIKQQPNENGKQCPSLNENVEEKYCYLAPCNDGQFSSLPRLNPSIETIHCLKV